MAYNDLLITLYVCFNTTSHFTSARLVHFTTDTCQLNANVAVMEIYIFKYKYNIKTPYLNLIFDTLCELYI